MRELSIFEGLSNKELLMVPSFAKGRLYEGGEILFNEGEKMEAIYLIKSGQVKLSRLFKNGKEITLQIISSDQVLGENALFSDSEHAFTATVVEDAFICACTKQEFERLIDEYPQVGLKIIKTLGKKLEQFTKRVDSLAMYDVKGRLINLFFHLSEEYGIESSKGVTIDLELTHQDVAEFIGASRVMVTKALSQLEGIIKHNKKFMISEPDSLLSLIS
ncbi:CRP/FNR family transcriptional regulator, anaerobic regulatory protein [Selenihalanaerobacter shriftii]|uniref:CRP/FNR family transcriptional regulator, anaerobic regulatory protein n=2 Tax=Selenihalanaerobacter shriftii TaxID=142842 RepID=A0A1T4NWW5_9FIRM|nr:CRP/FNR family transcriptional regulator, anaerobic regulatory protein [Selenihalanaerobacter shriftii]